ncbi:conserved hypothetical protein [Vibrio chagasii]|nr:conserved hypothetical protein [Vibrio chagasii]
MDVAGALAMAKDCEIGKLVLVAKVADDKAEFEILVKALEAILKHDQGGKAKGLALVIATEIINPLHCARCHGRGTVMKYENMTVLCEHCHGYGIKWRSSRNRARLAEIPITTWSRRNFSKLVSDWVLLIEKEVGHAEKKLMPQ